MTDQRTLKAAEVATHVETLLPPIAEIMQVDTTRTPDDLSPFVTLPTIYVHIIIQGLRAEVLSRENEALEAQNREMEAVIAKAERKPKSVMDDEQITAGAVHLATEAHGITFSPDEAAMCLWKAAAAIAVVHFPPANALNALDGIHAMIREDVAQAIGMGATKQ